MCGPDVCLSLSHFSLILCDEHSYQLSAILVCISPFSPLTHCMINSLCCRGARVRKTTFMSSFPYLMTKYYSGLKLNVKFDKTLKRVWLDMAGHSGLGLKITVGWWQGLCPQSLITFAELWTDSRDSVKSDMAVMGPPGDRVGSWQGCHHCDVVTRVTISHPSS